MVSSGNGLRSHLTTAFRRRKIMKALTFFMGAESWPATLGGARPRRSRFLKLPHIRVKISAGEKNVKTSRREL